VTRRPPTTHWLRENHQERSPRRVLVVDAETMPVGPDDPDRQLLRLWCARLDRRKGTDPKRPRVERFRGRTGLDLVDLVESLARADAALWLLTHNLSFDLAVTELPVLLTEHGWTLTEAALTTESPWARMRHGSRRLTIADTFSWLPTSVDELGALVGRPKLPLPAWDAPEPDWWARCEVDVEITANAIGSAMDWWDAGRFGNWSITGPATGWSSYRHRRPAPRVLVVPDPEARRLEARAVSGGRRQVRRIGELPDGLYADLDLETAHLSAMAGLPLPARRLRAIAGLPLDHRALDSNVLDVLAECELETTAPRYPWDSGRGVFYPTGRFRTVLAGPEVREARRRGELRSIGAGYLYGTSPHMAEWALWIASLLNESTPGVPPAVRLMAKHWSRCVPGKWAGRSSEVLSRDPDPRPGWAVERAMLMPQRRPADLLRIGGERWTIVRDEWADDAFPAVVAWIQSATRVAVSRLIDRLGGTWQSVNTDGVLVDARALAARWRPESWLGRPSPTRTLRTVAELCAAWGPELDPFSVRIKEAAGRVRVISPQHLLLDDRRRLAGIPRGAKSLAGGRYTFLQWPKLRVQLQRPDVRGYSTRQAKVDLAHVPPAGWLLRSGEVVPIRLGLVDGAVTVLEPQDAATGAPLDLDAPERQHVLLRPLAAVLGAAA